MDEEKQNLYEFEKSFPRDLFLLESANWRTVCGNTRVVSTPPSVLMMIPALMWTLMTSKGVTSAVCFPWLCSRIFVRYSTGSETME